jgi:hypothetical protein
MQRFRSGYHIDEDAHGRPEGPVATRPGRR